MIFCWISASARPAPFPIRSFCNRYRISTCKGRQPTYDFCFIIQGVVSMYTGHCKKCRVAIAGTSRGTTPKAALTLEPYLKERGEHKCLQMYLRCAEELSLSEQAFQKLLSQCPPLPAASGSRMLWPDRTRKHELLVIKAFSDPRGGLSGPYFSRRHAEEASPGLAQRGPCNGAGLRHLGKSSLQFPPHS